MYRSQKDVKIFTFNSSFEMSNLMILTATCNAVLNSYINVTPVLSWPWCVLMPVCIHIYTRWQRCFLRQSRRFDQWFGLSDPLADSKLMPKINNQYLRVCHRLRCLGCRTCKSLTPNCLMHSRTSADSGRSVGSHDQHFWIKFQWTLRIFSGRVGVALFDNSTEIWPEFLFSFHGLSPEII